MSEKKSFWQLWKDTLVILATFAIVLYSLNAILHIFNPDVMTRLVLTCQIEAVIAFLSSWVIITVCRWLYSRRTRRQIKVSK